MYKILAATEIERTSKEFIASAKKNKVVIHFADGRPDYTMKGIVIDKYTKPLATAFAHVVGNKLNLDPVADVEQVIRMFSSILEQVRFGYTIEQFEKEYADAVYVTDELPDLHECDDFIQLPGNRWAVIPA